MGAGAGTSARAVSLVFARSFAQPGVSFEMVRQPSMESTYNFGVSGDGTTTFNDSFGAGLTLAGRAPWCSSAVGKRYRVIGQESQRKGRCHNGRTVPVPLTAAGDAGGAW